MAPELSYSIKDLERLTGIKAHTIRIWEKRYGIPYPDRSQSNIRYYSDHHLRYLLNVAILRNKGLKISDIAALDSEEMNRLVLNGSALNGSSDRIERMILAMLNLDEEMFQACLSQAIVSFGLEETFQKIIHPFFNRIGLMWLTGTINPAQEHFVSNIIRQKLITAINGQDAGPAPMRKTFLIFLPEGEIHELGLLLHTYIIRKNGHRVIYLGQSTPLDCVKNVFELSHPEVVLTSLTTARSPEWVKEFTVALQTALPNTLILLSGPQLWQDGIAFPAYGNLKRFSGAEELKSILTGDLNISFPSI